MKSNVLKAKAAYQLSLISAIIFAFAWPSILEYSFPQYDLALLPNIQSTALAFLCIIGLSQLHNKLTQLMLALWVGWYFIGTINTISSSLILRDYYSNLDLNKPGIIYLLGCLFAIFGALLHQTLFPPEDPNIGIRRSTKYRRPSIIFRIFLYIFPLAWLVSLRLNVGYIPILTGESIESDMYETSYGTLYNYSFLLVPAALLWFEDQYRKKNFALAYIGFFFTVLISLADGKRAIALTAMLGLFALMLCIEEKRSFKKILYGLILLITLYVAVQIARTGGDTTRLQSDSLAYLMKVGVEYRDFAYTSNYIPPGGMTGYDWLLSSIGAFTNSGVLSLLDMDKAEMVSHGSAQVWSDFFSSPFGIRTGIISEIWFEYGKSYLLILALFGGFSSWVSNIVLSQKYIFDRSLLATIFGLLTLSVVGQSTVLFGVLSILLYLYIASRIERIVLFSYRATTH